MMLKRFFDKIGSIFDELIEWVGVVAFGIFVPVGFPFLAFWIATSRFAIAEPMPAWMWITLVVGVMLVWFLTTLLVILVIVQASKKVQTKESYRLDTEAQAKALATAIRQDLDEATEKQ